MCIDTFFPVNSTTTIIIKHFSESLNNILKQILQVPYSTLVLRWKILTWICKFLNSFSLKLDLNRDTVHKPMERSLTKKK